MKIPLSWLKEFVDLSSLSTKEIAERLTLLGIEVDAIEDAVLSFSGIVVGKVLTASRHPNADRLTVATVTDGKQEYQVVCGAPNCRAGLISAFAPIGATLKDETGKSWKIKKSKLRDVESFGMLCSEKELGFVQKVEGSIIELPEDWPIGKDLSSFYSNPTFEVSLTPNLGHCMSMLGVARELAASLNVKVKMPATSLKEDGEGIEHLLDVNVEDKEKCLRYACRVLRGVTVGPSPEWLQKRLESVGLRSINNVVDVANFVMFEMGQPLHIFDYECILGKKIIVTSGTSYPSLVTLDGKNHEIPKEALLICDAEKPLAFAGIMGGISSAASEKTKHIVIESALFSPQAIRKACRLLDFKSDSSQRFERGIDPCGLIRALDRAASLIQQIAGGTAVKGRIDRKEKEFEPKKILCRTQRVNDILGTELSSGEIASMLQRLEMKVSPDSVVEVPTYRNDVTAEIDLVEEVARIYGYNNLPKRNPRHVSSELPDAPIYTFEKSVRTLLLQEGLQECITCDLISPQQSKMTLEKGVEPIPVLHPSSVDQSILRSSLLPGLLAVVKTNSLHQIHHFSGFEVGRVHFKDGSEYKEQTCAGIILTGESRPHHWDRKPSDVDFYDVKGMVENLLKGVGISKVSFEPSHFHTLHPWRQAYVKIKDNILGVIGEVNPHVTQSLELKTKVYFAELNLHDLFMIKKKEQRCTPLPQYPGSERDWTISIKEAVPIARIFQAIESSKQDILQQFMLLDLYKSPQIGKDRKNATFRFIYRDPNKTLDIETVEREHQKLIQAVAEKLKDCLL